MGGGGHGDPIDVPHFRKWDACLDHPEILKHQRKLRAIGLHDPWMRCDVPSQRERRAARCSNYAWRYTPEYRDRAGGILQPLKHKILRGWRAGLLIAATVVAIDEGYLYYYYGRTSWTKHQPHAHDEHH